MAGNINVMEFIWKTIDKAHDGCVYYTLEFIDFLWDHGFVDTQKFSRQVWRSAFEPYKQANGSFKLNQAEFFTLDKYRYTGEIYCPFDAMQINEGKYTDEGFEQLSQDSIHLRASSRNSSARTPQGIARALRATTRQRSLSSASQNVNAPPRNWAGGVGCLWPVPTYDERHTEVDCTEGTRRLARHE